MAKAAEPTDAATMWRKFFEDWPKGVPTRGVLVNRLDEQVPFKAYMVRGAFVLLERSSPDALGARYLVLPFAEVSMVKFIDPLKQEVLDSAGFRGKLTQ